jgi:hypothetical protein
MAKLFHPVVYVRKKTGQNAVPCRFTKKCWREKEDRSGLRVSVVGTALAAGA